LGPLSKNRGVERPAHAAQALLKILDMTGMRRPAAFVNARGFTLAELSMVAAMIGLLAVLATPTFLSYWRSSTLRAGAGELAAAVNLGRQVAISRNTTVCVQVSSTSIVMRTGGCGGTVWTGPGTDGSGVIRLANAFQVSSGGNVVFTGLGGASTAGSFTVTNPVDGATRTVIVSTSGRVTVQ
jgi:prepilin-type N-terminal cleavage/methylation domain-containing protein